MSIIVNRNRKSEIELLRVLSMLMVLLLHFNVLAFRQPMFDDFLNSPIIATCRMYSEMLCIVAVNIFVFISGWFGIRSSVKGFTKVILQVFTYSVILYLMWIFVEHPVFSFSVFLKNILIVGKFYWFVVSYLLLYILSPILNTFVDNCSSSNVKKFLIAYFLFQFIYSWYGDLENFNKGFSTLSFIGIYLLARYLNSIEVKLKRIKAYIYLIGYLFFSLIPVLIMLFVSFYHLPGRGIALSFIKYNSPLMIISTTCLFLFFVKQNIKSNLINYVSSSAFSVYLIHMHPYWSEWLFLKERELWHYMDNNVAFVFVVIVFSILFFLICVIIDKIRESITPYKLIVPLMDKIWWILCGISVKRSKKYGKQS